MDGVNHDGEDDADEEEDVGEEPRACCNHNTMIPKGAPTDYITIHGYKYLQL